MNILLTSLARYLSNRPYILTSLIIILLQIPAGANTIPASGTTLSSADFKKIFSNIVEQNKSLSTPERGQQQRVVNFSTQPTTITLPPGLVSYQVISHSGGNQLGRKIIGLAILIDGHEQSRVTLSGDLQLFGSVTCLSRTVRRHTILSQDDLEIIQRNLTMLGPDFIREPRLAIGRELKTTLQPGAILYGRLLKKPTVVKRGDLVEIQANSGSLIVKAAGQIKTSGAMGDIVRVKNLMSRKEIYARVISPNKVQVDF